MITAVQKHIYIKEDIDFYFSYAKSIDWVKMGNFFNK